MRIVCLKASLTVALNVRGPGVELCGAPLVDETRPSETDEAASEYKDRNTATTVTTTSFT